jgi:rod shape-determining protein MreC
MKQYINTSYKTSNNSFKHSFILVFSKIETVLFAFLCVVFLAVSQINEDFNKSASSAFLNVSLPVVRVAGFPFNMVITLLTEFSELVAAKAENENLKVELQNLKNFYLASIDIKNENEELRDTLGFVRTKSSNFKVARIIGKTNQVFNQKIFIDSGEDKGIKKDQIVTTIQGVVGRVDEVFANKSRLILINDAESRIPVMASKSRVRGILAGDGSNLMEILYLPENHKVDVGDLVFTSGDGDTLPSGLFVGTVKKVDHDTAYVAMPQDLAEINVVTILEF